MQLKSAHVLLAALLSAIAGQSVLAATADLATRSKPVCLENFCLFDPVSKYPEVISAKSLTGNIFAGTTIRPAPVCFRDYVPHIIRRKDGSQVTLGFTSVPSSKAGEQYRLTQVSISTSGNFTDAQLRELSTSLRDRFGLVAVGDFFGHESKNDWSGVMSQVSYFSSTLTVTVKYTPKNASQDADLLRGQPGCTTNVPRL